MATILLSAATADAGDDPLLRRLVGDWIGTGSFRWDSASDADPLWCRVSGALDADGTLRQSGRCSLPDQAVSFSVEIHPAGGGKYTGKASGPFGAGGASFTGTGRSTQITLVAQAADGGPPVNATLEVTAGGFRLKGEKVDPDTGQKYVPADVTFGPP